MDYTAKLVSKNGIVAIIAMSYNYSEYSRGEYMVAGIGGHIWDYKTKEKALERYQQQVGQLVLDGWTVVEQQQ